MVRMLLAGALGVVLLPLAQADAQETTKVAPGTPVNITVSPATPSSPTVVINLSNRTGRGIPTRHGFNHTGGGNIDVQQPSADTLVITLTGVAVAGGCPGKCSTAALDFDITQCFEVSFEKDTVKAAKMTMEARVIGLLRTHCKGGGAAEVSGSASVACELGGTALSAAMPGHTVCCGENLSVNDKDGPHAMPIGPGKYTLHQVFHVAASHPKAILPCKAASAEFAPDPALDPLWISYWEPFHGAAKKDFGFQITVKVAEDTTVAAAPAKKDAKKPEKLPPVNNGN